MTFSGFPFLFAFLPLFLCGAAIFGRVAEPAAKFWLIAVSVVFYGLGAAAFLPLLVLSIGGNFALLHAMHASARPGWWAASGVALNLAVLGWFKYLAVDGMVPLGLSFFTFTQIGCLLHHADGGTSPPRARDYALFAGFFPSLLAGPILNPRDLFPQIAQSAGGRLTADNLAVGSGFFLIGLLKKALLADPLSGVVAAGFADPLHLTLFAAWQAAASYSLQLYFDFSGYSDMAIGVAWMVGLRFPDNFDRPYRAGSVIAYWQRWHMSLTRFLMANIHAPMTLSILRYRRRRRYGVDANAQKTAGGFAGMIGLPIVSTMVLVSLWHGATWPFLLFGLMHAAMLLINHAWRIASGPGLPAPCNVALTYLCVLLAAVMFRAPSVADAGALWAGMVGMHGLGAIHADIHVLAALGWLLALYAIVWFAPTTRQWMQPEPTARFGWHPSPRWAVAMGGAASLGILAAGGTSEFLYFKF